MLGRSAALFDERSVGAIFFLSSVLGVGVVLLGLYEDMWYSLQQSGPCSPTADSWLVILVPLLYGTPNLRSYAAIPCARTWVKELA